MCGAGWVGRHWRNSASADGDTCVAVFDLARLAGQQRPGRIAPRAWRALAAAMETGSPPASRRTDSRSGIRDRGFGIGDRFEDQRSTIRDYFTRALQCIDLAEHA